MGWSSPTPHSQNVMTPMSIDQPGIGGFISPVAHSISKPGGGLPNTMQVLLPILSTFLSVLILPALTLIGVKTLPISLTLNGRGRLTAYQKRSFHSSEW